MENVIDIRLVEEPKKPLSMNPKKFGLWLFLASVVMIFMSLTSAYLVKRADGNWLFFELPSILYGTSAVIILSSVTMQLSYHAFKKEKISSFRFYFFATLVLGIVFLYGQFLAWKELTQHHVYLVGNPAGSFVYLIMGLHGLHIVSALIVLLVMSYQLRKPTVTSSSKLYLNMTVTYWHFLGILWLYLLAFFILFR